MTRTRKLLLQLEQQGTVEDASVLASVARVADKRSFAIKLLRSRERTSTLRPECASGKNLKLNTIARVFFLRRETSDFPCEEERAHVQDVVASCSWVLGPCVVQWLMCLHVVL